MGITWYGSGDVHAFWLWLWLFWLFLSWSSLNLSILGLLRKNVAWYLVQPNPRNRGLDDAGWVRPCHTLSSQKTTVEGWGIWPCWYQAKMLGRAQPRPKNHGRRSPPSIGPHASSSSLSFRRVNKRRPDGRLSRQSPRQPWLSSGSANHHPTSLQTRRLSWTVEIPTTLSATTRLYVVEHPPPSDKKKQNKDVYHARTRGSYLISIKISEHHHGWQGHVSSDRLGCCNTETGSCIDGWNRCYHLPPTTTFLPRGHDCRCVTLESIHHPFWRPSLRLTVEELISFLLLSNLPTWFSVWCWLPRQPQVLLQKVTSQF